NVGTVAVDAFSLVDELDRLNAVASFMPGTLTVVSAPAGADTTGTNATGGAKGPGVLNVAGLDLPPGATLQGEVEIQPAPVLANGSDVANQSQLMRNGFALAVSDDPNVNGRADPLIAGDEDPTRIKIQSAPRFTVKKVSADLDGDPAVLLAGERLRYTI